jgi:hypothetical protein
MNPGLTCTVVFPSIAVMRAFFVSSFILTAVIVAMARAESRTWTDASGKGFAAEYLSSTPDSVMIRHANGLAVRTKLTDLSEVDRAYVDQRRAAELEATMMEARFSGEVSWRLPSGWSSVGWTQDQPIEIWLCDPTTLKPTSMLIATKAKYRLNTASSARNQFEGSYRTESVRFSKNARIAVLSKFSISLNEDQKQMTETSTARQLPVATGDTIKLTPFRVTVKR